MNFINQLKRRKVYSSFKDNIWGVALANMQLLRKHNKGIRFLLCVIDLFSKYAWNKTKDKKTKDKKKEFKRQKRITVVNVFQRILGS